MLVFIDYSHVSAESADLLFPEWKSSYIEEKKV